MGSLEIAISGIHTAQNALDVIGNNIANAATDGYHRQELDMRPARDLFTNGQLLGQGVESVSIKRHVNELLEKEIISKESTLTQIERELESLVTLESAFGEMTTSALSGAIDTFYSSLHKLSEEPTSVIYQSDVASTARSMANQFRNVGAVATNLEDLTYSEAQNTVEEINQYATQIGEMNKQIHRTMVTGDNPNNMLDRRDNLLTELSRLIGISTSSREYGVVDVVVGDIPLVMNTTVIELEAGLVPNGDDYDLGVAIKDENNFCTDITGGKFGALVSLRNDILRDVRSQLNNVANNIIFETNKVHCQGIGSYGSFERLTGWSMSTLELSEIEPAITNGGEIFVRLIAPDGTTMHCVTPITVNLTDDLNDIANSITLTTFGSGPAISPLVATVSGDKLQIEVDAVTYPGYKFDFVPGVLPDPTSSTLTGGGGGEAEPTVTISGVYSGDVNETYTFTVSGAAAGGSPIGSGNAILTVTDSSFNTIATIPIGDDYVSGDAIFVDEGIKVSLGSNGTEVGYVQNGQTFTVRALATSDSSGLLAACGINTFFKGTSATSMALVDDVDDNLNRIAVARTFETTDNENALKMAQLGDTAMSDLNDLTVKEYYRGLATSIGEKINMSNLDQENTYGVWSSLTKQRDDTSGVDMNDEAARMMVFERMFQGMAKYMNVVSTTTNSLMGILG